MRQKPVFLLESTVWYFKYQSLVRLIQHVHGKLRVFEINLSKLKEAVGIDPHIAAHDPGIITADIAADFNRRAGLYDASKFRVGLSKCVVCKNQPQPSFPCFSIEEF